MTDRGFRPAGWSAPVVLAPCAAALFGASMWWAAHAMPTTASSQPPAATSHATRSGDATNRSQAVERYLATVAAQRHTLHRELEHALATRRHEARVVTRRLHQLTGEIAKAETAAAYQPPPVSYPAPISGPAPVAPIQVAPAPAPPPAPPPVQANTGASGAP